MGAVTKPTMMTTARRRCGFIVLLINSASFLGFVIHAFDVPFTKTNPQRSALFSTSTIATSTTRPTIEHSQQQQQQQKQIGRTPNHLWLDEVVERNMAADRIEQAVFLGVDYKTISAMVDEYSRRFNIPLDGNSSSNNLEQNLQQTMAAFVSSVGPPDHSDFYDDEEETQKALDKAARYIEKSYQSGCPIHQVRAMVEAYARVKMHWKRQQQQQQQQQQPEINALEQPKQEQPSLQEQQLANAAAQWDPQRHIMRHVELQHRLSPEPPITPPSRLLLAAALAEVDVWKDVDAAAATCDNEKSQQGDLNVPADTHKRLMP